MEEVTPVLQRVAKVLEAAQAAQGWPQRFREDAEAMQSKLENSAQIGLQWLEDAAQSAVPAPAGSGPTGPSTPVPVTRGSGRGTRPHSGQRKAHRKGKKS